MDKYLPIGSVVLLRDGSKRVMIYGRKQQQLATGIVWDYIACLYPEGNLDEEYMYLFNHDQIEHVFFLGYQDDEEFAFAREYLNVASVESADALRSSSVEALA